MASSSDMSLDELHRVIRYLPVIDNHAHNLLRSDKIDTYSLLTATTEAQGHALEDTLKSLAHHRAVRQLRELYGCDKNASWDDLMHNRRLLLEKDPNALTRKCLEGTHTILMDDGIDNESTVHSYSWHDQFTIGRTKRIVRIETVAADIMKAMCQDGGILNDATLEHFDPDPVWVLFLQAFETAIADEIKNEEVVGFKSVCCYRTGLDVKLDDDIKVTAAGQEAFLKYLYSCATGNFRISVKGLNDCLVISTSRLLTEGYSQTGISKPLQFHTGLGDNDISLLKSNPAHLQPLIAAFPHVQVVMLHSSYPYTREAGYLATVYKNAYLDLGEVFPMVGRDGQTAIIREALEITPTSKLLWSTDGHHHPETYWLANKQFREVFERVLTEYVLSEDLTAEQAVDAATDIMFSNSNRLYNLGLSLLDSVPSVKVSPHHRPDIPGANHAS